MQLSGECRGRKENVEWIKTKLLYEGRSTKDDIIKILNNWPGQIQTKNNNLFCWNYHDTNMYLLKESLQQYADDPATLLQQYELSQQDNKIELKVKLLPDNIETITIEIK